MPPSHTIKPTTAEDTEALGRVVDATGLFPSEMLPDMLSTYLAGGSDELWLSCHLENGAVGLCYARREALTDGCWNMLALAVDPGVQGQGLGAALVAAMEDRLRGTAGRLLIVDTSGSDAFARTRAFYMAKGYEQEACIRDYWAEGDAKITFRKRLV